MFQRLIASISMAASLVAVPSPAQAAPGDLDPTFGQDGRVFTNVAVPGFSGIDPGTESILVQRDRKILVCGRYWHDGYSTWTGTLLVRYLPNGALDPSFGENGKVALPGLGPDRAVGADMVLQPDGKIVLIGETIEAFGGIIVQRYTSSGVLDTTFGDDGTVFVSREIEGMQGRSIALQPDGKIVAAVREFATLLEPYYGAIVVFRLNTDGSMDDTFGADGTGVTTIANGYSGRKVLVQPGGKILVAGTLLNFADVPPTPILARYDSDGVLDTSFGTSGTVTHRIHDQNSFFSSAALQPDGKIIAVGTTTTSAPSACRSFVVRYDSSGSLDTSFGTDGVSCFASSFFNSPTNVFRTHAGKIVATGNAPDPANGGNRFAIVRLTSSGSLDPSFGVGGRSLVAVDGGATVGSPGTELEFAL